MKKPDLPVQSANGASIEFNKVGAGGWAWRDLYHWIMTLNWGQFCVFLMAIYLLVNSFFAVLFCLGGACVDGMPAGSFPSAFFFSVETLATVGYGHMYPVSFYAHVVVTAEIVVGMFGTAVMTGLIFVRFSRPTARLLFSRVMCLSNYNGQPALMLRVANERRQPMVNARFRLMMLRHEPTLEDPTLFRFHSLKLQIDHLIFFPAAITIRHLIDDQSPLRGASAESFEREGVRFMASIECVDKALQAPVQDEQLYGWRDVRFDHRFVEIYDDESEGPRRVHYGRLHDTEPCELPQDLAVAAPAVTR